MKYWFVILTCFPFVFLSSQVAGIPLYSTPSSAVRSAVVDSCAEEQFFLDPEFIVSPSGVHVRGNDCWVYGFENSFLSLPIYLQLIDLSTANNDTIFSVEVEEGLGSAGDIYVQEDTVWAILEEASLLMKYHAYTGELLGQFNLPSQDNNMWGITSDGTDLLINDYSTNFSTNSTIYRYNTQLEAFVDSIIVEEPNMLGIQYMNGKIYGIGPFINDSLLVINPANGNIDEKLPWCIPVPYGLSYDPLSDALYSTSGLFQDGTGHIYRIKIDDIISSNENQLNNISSFTISPNPVSDWLNIFITSRSTSQQIDIYNNSGQRILNQSFTGEQKQLDVNGLSPGLYYLRVSNSSGIKTQKFIKL